MATSYYFFSILIHGDDDLSVKKNSRKHSPYGTKKSRKCGFKQISGTISTVKNKLDDYIKLSIDCHTNVSRNNYKKVPFICADRSA